jgi:hypothetical protein
LTCGLFGALTVLGLDARLLGCRKACLALALELD